MKTYLRHVWTLGAGALLGHPFQGKARSTLGRPPWGLSNGILRTYRCPLAALASAAALIISSHLAAEPVRLSEETVALPTYKAGPPDPNPMFFFGRESQGAEGRTYPYPLYDNLTNQKGEQSYHLIYLENEYVKIAIAPEIGGRLFSAVDKTNNYDFVYHQHVIKPALIGLIGAWISGGIEWNIPHHHRASTFLPVQYRATENADGSKTVWVGELEIRHRMRWAVGYTLHPGSSVLTCSVRIVNRTPVANTMLCFANLAVNANENYQIIFPPSTQWVTFHSKREFASWPIARSRYAGADFTAGVDVSWYKNHLNSNSMFAWNDSDDFFAGYDHGKEAGTMSVADHHIVPGKKFWTWGNGPRGRMWDDILTDTDGPYIELMVGAYSDNQPDYSWLQPFETRSFEMNWYPFRDIGGVKNANLDAAVNLEVRDNQAKFGFSTTRAFPEATAQLKADDKVFFEEKITIDPAKPYTKQFALPTGLDEHDVHASLLVEGREIVGYSPVRLVPLSQPEVVTPPLAPKEIKTDEEVFLAGQRIDQFHNPTLDADPYWEETLRRDPGDTAAHTGLGRLDLRRAKFASAEEHFRAALARLTAKYTTPKDAEPFYYLGVALKAQDKISQAYDAFYKATWSQEWKGPAYFSLAEIAATRGDFSDALNFIDRSLDANALNLRAYGLKSALLRHLNRGAEARAILTAALSKTDPLDVRLMAESWLASKDPADARPLVGTLNDHPATAQELAADYGGAGLWGDASDVLAAAVAAAPDKLKVSPLVYYYLGYFAEKMHEGDKATEYRRSGMQQPPDYVFPFQSDIIPVLRAAIAANPHDARALYYLANLLFDWQPAEAVTLWEKSVELDPKFPIAWRNLAQAYAHQRGDAARAKAIVALEKAVSLSDAFPTHFAELDELYQATGVPVEKRLAMLEAHWGAVASKDELLAVLANLKTFTGQADQAIALLQTRTFSVWEGGTRFNTGESWANAHIMRGLQQYSSKRYKEALADFTAALKYPAQLRASDAVGNSSRQAEVAYWRGCANEALGTLDNARSCWTEAANIPAPTVRPGGRGNPLANRSARYFQALALQKLGQPDAAVPIFHELVEAGRSALKSKDSTDLSSAKSRPPSREPGATAHYIAGLGYSGLGDKEKARSEFTAALSAAPDHLGAKLALDQL